jgi:hypothetical protein
LELEVVGIEDVWPTPEEVALYPTYWPNISKLKLSVELEFLDGRLPRINHTHIMELLSKCKNLHTLGLRFDATGVKTGEHFSAVDGNQLTALFVGDSPMYSLERVSAFLALHFPRLKALYSCTPDTSEGVLMYLGESSFGMGVHRWKLVAQRLHLLTI